MTDRKSGSNDANIPGETVAHGDIHALLHELNQPLTAIGNYARAGRQLLDGSDTDAGRLGELFDKIAAQSERSCEISRELSRAVGRT